MRAALFITVLVIVAGAAAFFCYAFTWSVKFLAPVQIGMSRSQVQTLIGSPPHTHISGVTETWDYTRPWSSEARVHFDTSGVVWAIETD